ncbi:MAG: response regulator, partial [Chloroflexi bacterium]|nr:response regulator [Chloroflexota bacterium]
MPDKILVVDDHSETLKVVSFILEQHGYQVVSARSGVEGLTLAETVRPALIVLDVMMPEMDGLEVCRRLRARPEFNHTPILFFTVKALVDDKWAGFQAGADDYLTKPTDPSELARRVKTLLVRSRDSAEEVAGMAGVDTLEADDQSIETGVPGPTGPYHLKPAGDNCLIVVTGVRGGVGTTTVAVNLAATLADEGEETILVDMDMNQGHVGLYLNQKIHTGLNELTRCSAKEISQQLPYHLVEDSKHLRLLLTRPNLDDALPMLNSEQAVNLVQALLLESRYVVLDIGRGLRAEWRPVVQLADHIIVCTRPERVA